MGRYVVLLSAVNLAGTNRVPMAKLREALEAGGFEDVATIGASGNVVLSAAGGSEAVRRRCERLIADAFGFEVECLVRTRAELAAVVERNPFGAEAAGDPKRLQVTFLGAKPAAQKVREASALAAGGERVEFRGSEAYAWHPDGVGRSKLAAKLGRRGLGVPATARNWSTVTKLLDLADAP